MSKHSISLFLIGAAVLALGACSGDKGPGEIGSIDDIVVRNKGIPGSENSTAKAPQGAVPGQDFSSTVEQGEAVPAPEVAAAEPVSPPAADTAAPANAAPVEQQAQPAPLPDTTPAVEQAVNAQEAANAPVPSPAVAPTSAQTAPPTTDQRPLDSLAPAQPVTQSVEPPAQNTTPAATAATVSPAPATPPAPAETPVSSVYLASDYQQAVPTTETPATTEAATTIAAAPVSTTASAPVASTAPVKFEKGQYPLDPNAPYSPKAVAAAAASAGTPVTEPKLTENGINLNDAAIIRSTQAALAAKAIYVGPQTGIMDAELLNAITKYQAANGLPQGGLNEATLKSLGIIE